MKVSLDGTEFDVEVESDAVTVNGTRYQVSMKGDGHTRTVIVNGRTVWVRLEGPDDSGVRPVNADGKIYAVKSTGGAAAPARTEAASAGATRSRRASSGAVAAQMTGRVLRILVVEGETIHEGDPLLILEAMKMENEIRSPKGGTVKRIAIAVGDRVNAGDVLVEIE